MSYASPNVILEKSGVSVSSHVVVFGTGSIGIRHLGVIAKISGAQAVAIPVRPQRAIELIQKGMIVAQDIGAARELGCRQAIIATDTKRHVHDAMTAIRAGMDVLVEKPVGIGVQEALVLDQEAKKLGRRVYVGCVLRFSSSLNRFRDLLPSLGKLHHVRVECRSYLPDWRPQRYYRESYSSRKDEGGVMRDLIHEIDYAGWIFGWPTSLRAEISNLGLLGIESEELADIFWPLPDGGKLSIELDYLSRPTRRLMVAFGERGTLTWDGVGSSVTLELAGKEADIIRLPQERDQIYQKQTEAFFSAIEGYSDDRLATLKDGIRALAVVDAARRSCGRDIEKGLNAIQ